VKILNQKKTNEGDMLYLIGADAPEFVVKVTDRQSRILGRHVAETVAYTARPPRPGQNAGAQGVFHSSCCEPPALLLAIASVEAAAAALAGRSHRSNLAQLADDLDRAVSLGALTDAKATTEWMGAVDDLLERLDGALA
jgi:hypothetical protein